jgi:hypothetical protein
LFNNEAVLLATLLAQDPTCLPGGLTLKTLQELSPDTFPGAAELQNIYQQDPFSTEYETSTQALYERAYAIARSIALSGPTNVRGGTARIAFEVAELDTQMANNRFREIWQNQVTLAQVVTAAVQIANMAAENMRRTQLQAQQQQAGTEQGRVIQSLSAAEQLSRLRSDHVRGFAAGGEFLGQGQMTIDEALQGKQAQGGTQSMFGTSYWR